MQYAIDESEHYWFGSQEVDYATWDANVGGGFYHWGDTLLLFDFDADYMDAYHRNEIDNIILSMG